jgi:hypothetical protein
MKKVFIVMSLFGLLYQASVADDAANAVTGEEQSANEDSPSSGKDNHEGVYGAFGLTVSTAKGKATLKDYAFTASVPGGANIWTAGIVPANAAQRDAHARTIILGELAQLGLPVADVHAVTLDAFQRVTSFSAHGPMGEKLVDNNSTNPGAWVAVGYGHFFGSGYVGGELSCDITGSKEKTDKDTSVKLKHGGFVPAIGVRLGVFNDCTGILAYVKCGIAFSKLTANTYDGRAKANFSSPIIALGCEKNLGSLAVRGEIEYRKSSGKNATISRTCSVDGFLPAPYPTNDTTCKCDLNLRLKSEGWAVRFVAVKSIKGL